MYTIQRLTTCSTRVRKTKNSIARDLNKEERPLATLWPFESLQKKRVHHSLWSAIYRSLGLQMRADHLGLSRCGMGWGGAGWGGVGWDVNVHCQWQTLSRVRWRCGMWGCYRSLPATNTVDGTVKGRMGWGGVGCSRSLPVANTADRTVKVWDGVAVRGNNWSMWPWDLASLNSEVINIQLLEESNFQK